MLKENELLLKDNPAFELGKNFSSLVYLTNVTYFESRHEVLVEFSSKQRKFVRRFRFFPYTLLPSSIEKEKLVDLILQEGFKGFNIEEEGSRLVLRTISFSDLKKICNSISIYTGSLPVVLEPERAFLIEKNWSFFDAFEEKDDILFKAGIGVENLPKTFWNNFDLGFFVAREVSFDDALKLNREDALFLVELASWSNILLLPIGKVPRSINEKLEVFLENLFFQNAKMISFEDSKPVFFSGGFEPIVKKDDLSKISFSSVWSDLFSNNFYNLGPETRNCSCCVPFSLDSNNLLPSSLIKLEFLEDNFFFESSSDSFSAEYHNNMPYKDLRKSKKKEFFLNCFPIGPFFRGDFGLVPLGDAKMLVSEGKAKIVSSNELSSNESVHKINWFCKKSESFFSKEVRLLNSKMFLLGKVFSNSQNTLFGQSSFGEYYAHALYSSFHFLLLDLPNHLTSTSSKFYSTELARSIVSVQEATLARFKEFSVQKGYRVLHANRQNAYIKGFSSLKLARLFAEENRLPQPAISGFASKKSRVFA